MLHRVALPLLLLSYLGACTHSTAPVTIDASATAVPAPDNPQILKRIAFGSCNRLDLPQPLWRKLQEEKPDLWIWTGDVIYGDTEDMGKLSRFYAQQLKQPEYAGFLKSKVPVIGVYDDHDYGARDGGKNYPQRDESKRLFLDFVNEAQDSPRRKQPGIYTSYRFGPAGKRVKLLLIDNRYNRDEPGKNRDILGDAQWRWLEQELMNVDADLLVLVSGTQLLPFEHQYEKWADWPDARARMIDLLSRSPYKNRVVVSGDRHLGELSKFQLPNGTILWEVTSSGMTHSYRTANDATSKNSLRVGELLTRLNYGILEINWEGTNPAVSIEVHDINKAAIIKQTLNLQK